MIEKVAWMIGRVFDPFVVLPAVFIVAMVIAAEFMTPSDWRFAAYLGGLNVILPGVVFLWMVKTGGVNDWDITERELRIPLFHLVSGCQVAGLLLAYWQGYELVATILGAVFILTLMLTVATWFWKVSLHVAVNTAWVVLAVWWWGLSWWWLLVPVMVGWSRVVTHNHSLAQTVVGGVVSLIVMVGMLS